MKKRLLIISPYFVPTNAADMHRVRTSLPYYTNHGWEAEIITVAPRYNDMIEDELLEKSLPAGVVIHYVKALNKRWTSKLGLGSIALRSIWFYYAAVNKLLKNASYNLIFFSTTQFPVFILAVLWKARFKIKIVFDIQDPWHTNHYKQQPKAERPKKYWFSYHLNKTLEPIAMNAVDGLISVSPGYLKTLVARYPRLNGIPAVAIPFGLHLPDLDIAKAYEYKQPSVINNSKTFNLVYIGRGGYDLIPAFRHLLKAIQLGLQTDASIFQQVRIQLFGTSYAAAGFGRSTFTNEVEAHGLSAIVCESTDQLAYYQTINSLRAADLLFIPGPDQKDYTASKLFPYLMAQRPILAIVHPASAATSILNKTPHAHVFSLHENQLSLISHIKTYLKNQMKLHNKGVEYTLSTISEYTSSHLTGIQTQLFDQVCNFQK